MLKITLLSACILAFTVVSAQESPKAREVVALINDSRIDPAAFLKKHRAEILKNNSAYVAFLEKSKPVPAIVWDKGLEEMAKAQVEKNELNPAYKGANKICGFSSGKSQGNVSRDALAYVCDIYTNVNDKEYAYLGIYFSKDLSGYSFQWGMTCEREKVKYEFREKIDTSAVDFAKLNTAKNSPDLSDVEKRMVREINFVRAYPRIYAKIIAKYLDDQSNGLWGLTKDTYDAGMELIGELNALSPLSILQPEPCIIKATKIHGLDSEKRGFFAHEGSDGSMPWDRILRQCPDHPFGNENGAGNVSEDPRGPVISLLLDDGISSRGHRYNMLNEKWRYVGVYRYVGKKTPSYTMYQWIQNFMY